jgi:hypothetical protein
MKMPVKSAATLMSNILNQRKFYPYYVQLILGGYDETGGAISSRVNQGDKGWTLDVDAKAIEMLSPVDGKVIAINEELVHSPENINKDPYKTWFMK